MKTVCHYEDTCMAASLTDKECEEIFRHLQIHLCGCGTQETTVSQDNQ